ncbi:PREDICTED: probable carboxylesterase 120 [Tarenaya hassleriana]|uniref:probable carboxylesterase 120 n=1 Tax=Tarenaya hassleriana TaxID=28532 RepID=UPI00053C7D00|nr:PREDICTED: probable carboxylesterase 120 [Tarenaya hassleriana]XP_010531779.1 PREDICTED: probable carboxylesterase 120 [Tarenaya hassleriana]
MSHPSPSSDPYNYLGIVLNPDGTITRDLTRFQCAAATPDPRPHNPVISKDIPVNESKLTRIRLYLPTSAISSDEKLPLVVYFHGGGFVLGSVDFVQFHGFCSNMACDLHAVVASASYRLSPEHRLPAAYDDGMEALHRIRTSSDDWLNNHADLSNVLIMGTSAGGNLAHAVGLRASTEDLKPLQIRGLVLHHPFFGGVERSPSEIRLGQDPVLPPTVSDVFWELCLPVGADRDHEYSNPKEGLEGMVRVRWKVMVIGTEGDPLVDRQREVVELMKNNGVDVVGHFTDGSFHGAEIMDPSKAKSMFAIVRHFMPSSML